MMEKKQSFAETRRMPLVVASRSLGVARAVSRFASCYRYLRPLRQIAGKGGHSWIVLFGLCLVLMPQGQARAEVDARAVQRSIDRGIAYLRKTQNTRGGWEEFGGQSCGLSALCTLAMLNASVSREDADIVRAIRYLRTFEPNETYSVALQTLVYCQLGAAGDLPRIRRNVQWLVKGQKLAGAADRIGSWDYGSRRGSGDPSNAQFALLALGAAQDRGIAIDAIVFKRAHDYWVNRQQSNGGWAYGSGRRTSGSMTCAGIASVIIAGSRLDSDVGSNQIQCCGANTADEQAIEKGIQWLGSKFTLETNPGGDSMTYFYYLYAVERVGRLSGRRFIGEHDWYREGAEYLINIQDKFQGFWSNVGAMESGNIATSFALLFLSKGKRQVVAGRLKYGNSDLESQWQQHPDGLRQLVRHVEQDWGRDLTWQTIDANTASLNDLLQTPVLVISGTEAIQLQPEFSERLKQYVDQGGCILFEGEGGDGCGDASGFERSVKQLCQSWFEGAGLERLPPGHPIWSAQHKTDPALIGPDFWVYGVQACCRTAVFYVPQSLSCRWEYGDLLFHRDRGGKPLRQQVQAAIRVGENLIAYATGRELKDKLEQPTILPASQLVDAPRDTIQVAMLSLDAGGQEARRALPNATALIAARVPISLTAIPQPVGFDSQQLRDVPFLWIHGRTDFTWSDSQREVLREYVKNGGVILGSAVCGSQAFADAFRREMAKTLPDAPLNIMAPDHPALRASGGFDLRGVTIRTPASGGQQLSRRKGPPVLETAMVDDLVGVFFSPLDLSCALESPNSVQCPGYSTEDAANIVANLVLYSLQQ
ncbi:MAG: DUF4159 domain-containing protein [Rubripirellula sp.]|nr:DUF4159 domain-containing protein [Rubripirellula sp.]